MRDSGRPRFETESSRFSDLVEIDGNCPSTESGRDLKGSITSELGLADTDNRSLIGGMGCEKF